MKALAWILTAAAVLVGADVFMMSSNPAEPTSLASSPVTLGEGGRPTPPPD